MIYIHYFFISLKCTSKCWIGMLQKLIWRLTKGWYANQLVEMVTVLDKMGETSIIIILCWVQLIVFKTMVETSVVIILCRVHRVWVNVGCVRHITMFIKKSDLWRCIQTKIWILLDSYKQGWRCWFQCHAGKFQTVHFSAYCKNRCILTVRFWQF